MFGYGQRKAVSFVLRDGGEGCGATLCCVFAAPERLCRYIGTALSLMVFSSVPSAIQAQMTGDRASSLSAAQAAPQPTPFQPQGLKPL